MVPAEVVYLEKVPVLGTGKIDMVGVAKLVKDRAAAAPAASEPEEDGRGVTHQGASQCWITVYDRGVEHRALERASTMRHSVHLASRACTLRAKTFAGYGLTRSHFLDCLRASVLSAAHIAFAATDRGAVDAFHAAALAAGGRDNGAPDAAMYRPLGSAPFLREYRRKIPTPVKDTTTSTPASVSDRNTV
jgi:hypothetical protein